MSLSWTQVLLVENDADDAGLIRAALSASPGNGSFNVNWVRCLADALERLEQEAVDVVLLDLVLPDGQGIDVFDRIFRAAPDALILVLTADSDEETARRAVQHGAHDYLPKEHADAYWLPRALRYVTDRKAAEQVLRTAEETLFEEKERSRVMLESIGDAVLATDLQGNVTYLNAMAEDLTGWSRGEALGQPLAQVFNIIDGTTREAAVNPALRAIEQDRTVGLAMDCVLIRRDGVEAVIEDSAAPIHDRHGKVSGAVIVFHDSSQSRAVTERMAYMAQHDYLTGLPNRLLLMERLSRMITLADRHHKQLALLFLDLNDFKEINDSLGHIVGDQLLQSVAKRLTECVRASDTVSRQGGDEFVILLAEIEQPQDAVRVAETLHTALAEPHLIDGHEIHIGLSIGISVYPDDGNSVTTLLQKADMAMFHAKSGSQDKQRRFRIGMSSRAGLHSRSPRQ
ncbi:diguanylate cyclase domain-containing protein [Thiohalobacter thiocyanaticus]|uniref:Diguanylate cyclase n=1 Tax=Thiohalobacter thiocyanaticus TaxID=585455 RepID=A0A426QHW3_9GAMM|nr:diguanylate cyclase [Thiohalobacter thiocyanaticus]RRQ21337.1 diguanylate cyclase [Thiohalobacter thiocyanaticus]